MFASLFFGILIGVIVEHFRFKNNIIIERIKILSPILCEAYPIIERIVEDTNYALNVRQRNKKKDYLNSIKTIIQDLDEYKKWDEKYREAGIELYLRNYQKLNDSLNKMRIYSITAHIQDDNYIITILDELYDISKKCEDELYKF